MPRRSRRAPRTAARAFSVVEIMIGVVIVGLLAAIAIPSFSRYVKRSRTAEAAGLLNKMWLGAIVYYESDHKDSNGDPVARQFPGPATDAPSAQQCGCLPGGRCPGATAVWQTPVWSALAFSLSDPFIYLPAFSSEGTGGSARFTAVATGDLDCDGIIARFTRTGLVDPTTGDVGGQFQAAAENDLE